MRAFTLLFLITSWSSAHSNILQNFIDHVGHHLVIPVNVSLAHLVLCRSFVVGVYGRGRGFAGTHDLREMLPEY